MTDKNYLDATSTVGIYAEILLGILRYVPVKNTSSENEYQRKLTKVLKFEKTHDPDLFRACIDLLEDTQYAIDEVFENGLITKSDSHGEKYLRLYGVLNAYYLQLGVITDLARLFKLRGLKKIRDDLKFTKIIELRNKLGSHTTSYLHAGSEEEPDFYRLAQTSIDKWGSNLGLVGRKKDIEEVDLTANMKEFTNRVEDILDQIVSKELNSRTFKKEHFEWLKLRHDYVKENRLNRN
ncbi:hypothetical protein [Chryseobacterium sp. IT-36CA2]|uniref:hypothetical protein n=1 Tax=Chryseobacterium sp. IT-36CA2 TaxID=3026460 RepID=UPI0039DFFECE